MQDFRKLEVWHRARALTVQVYRLTASFPSHERFGLTGQMRRCAISLGSDIAEGSGRSTAPVILRFYQAAFATSLELLHQLITAVDLGYMTEMELASIEPGLETFRRKLSRLMVAIRSDGAKRRPRTDGSRSEPAENR